MPEERPLIDNIFLKCESHSCSSSFLKVAMLKLSNSIENLQLVGLNLDTTKYASQILVLHSENSPTRELPTADCCKTGIFDNKYREESFIFIWLSKKGLASMTKSVMIMQGTEKV